MDSPAAASSTMTPSGKGGAMADKLRFAIELCRCSQDGELFLSLVTDKDGGGRRITSHKPVIGTVVKRFHVGIDPEDLEKACALDVQKGRSNG